MDNTTKIIWWIVGIVVVIAIIVWIWMYYAGTWNTASLQGTQNTGNTQNTQNTGNQNTTQGQSLDLSNQNLASIPSAVFLQTDLQELDVSGNKLTGALPSQIGALKNLKILNAANNQFTGIPAEIGQLQNLQVLNFSNNKITGLPQELGNLKNLRLLDLSGNKVSSQDLAGIKSKLPATATIITD